MAGGSTLTVRQIGSYPLLTTVAGDSEALVLVQQGGVGGPYATISTFSLVQTALEAGGPMGIGYTPPPGATSNGLFTGELNLPISGGLIWGGSGTSNTTGGAGFVYEGPGFRWAINGANPMLLSNAGALSLPFGTLTVARDPASALEVATMGWVGANTVASFNGRRGAITLNGCDIYSALCLDSSIATESWVCATIKASTEMLLANHPFVFGWNGRTGAVYLTLADISCVFFQPGQQPITQTPPADSNDYSIPNTSWVVQYITNELAGAGGTIATQAWVLANTVNSFNGRKGVVTLTGTDVFDVGAAPLNAPQFSGIPTAPTANPGTSTGQIATTAFVAAAISASTAGVSSFNTRTGAVVLTNTDITGAGGLANPNVALTGTPTAPTATAGTSTTQIATTAFVAAALAAGTVSSFNTRTGAVTLQLTDVTGVGGAPVASPTFTGTPAGPTAAPGTATTQLATTQFVTAALTAAGGVSSFNSRTGAVTLAANDVSAVGGLINPSVQLTGVPTTPTAAPGTNTTQIASTAFVAAALAAGVTSFNTRTGAITLVAADITGAGGALLASPAFTGTPTAPTQAPGTNNTDIATTAFVTAAIAANTTGVTTFNTRSGAVTLLAADITAAGGALLASPALTGTPTGPTATAGTSTTQLATTAFVQAAVGAGAVTSFNSRTGAVTLQANDVSAVGGALLASPTFTGVPAGPTATAGTSTTQLATTQFVTTAVGAYLPLAGGGLTGALAINVAAGANALNIGGTGAASVGGNLLIGGTTALQSTLSVTGVSTLTGGINGITNGVAAAAGTVGQILAAGGGPFTVASGQVGTAATITLTPGDWDITGYAGVNTSDNSNIISMWAGFCPVANNNANAWAAIWQNQAAGGMTAGGNVQWSMGVIRLNVSTSTTVNANFQHYSASGATLNVSGSLSARRMH